ncbi:MAG: NADH-quinone oxidoreductase subunit N [Akkermansiaceae bacterium]|jgi:NADH-quinone oxidoreductase subunit N
MPSYLLEIIVLSLGLILLVFEAFTSPKKKSWIALVAIFGLVFTLICVFFAKSGFGDENRELTRFYAWDPMARFFKGFAIIATILTLLLALDYRKVLSKFTANPDSEDGTGEYYCLLLFACAGMMWMASAKDLVSLFVSLELTTITFYILVAYMRRNVGSLEAGVKYLILGALSTGFLVYGIAWLYGATGTTDLAEIATFIETQGNGSKSTFLLFGLSLLLISLAFKVGAVPMHLWIPDVYQGAPSPTTAFLSIASKASGFAIAVRVTEPFLASGGDIATKTAAILAILAGATILFGNLAAIPQKNFKRLLAYSSIANAGFLLMPLAAWQTATDDLTSKQVIMVYLAIYLITTFAAFFVLAVIHRNTGSDEISAFEGLAQRQPKLAFMTAVIIGALAGLPLTAGFWGKFLAFKTAVNGGLWVPVILGFVGVAAGFYYYFQIIRAMYWRNSLDESGLKISPIALYAITTLTIVTVILGFWPQPVLWLFGA